MASDRTPMCTSAEDLAQCITCDPTNIPVVEGNLFQTHAPISQADVDYLTGSNDPEAAQPGINFFTDGSPATTLDPTNPTSFSADGGLVRAGLRFRTQFLLDAICVKLHCEPQALAIDGNQFFTQAQIETNNMIPTSPEEFNWDAFTDIAGNRHLVCGNTSLTHCNAQLEVGSPIWRASHFALQAYRMSLQCPSSPRIHEIMNQRLVDIGNCCLGTEYEGFGTTSASERDWVAKVNRKLQLLHANSQAPVLRAGTTLSEMSNGITAGTDELGYFVPFNARQRWIYDETRNKYQQLTEASRMKVAPSAFGSLAASPNAYKYYRLAIPRVIDRDENIEITLTRKSGDNEFFQRMLRELSIQMCDSLIPNVGPSTADYPTGNICLGDGASYTSLTSARYVRIPTGLWRFGISLKGWLLDANLCGQIKTRFSALTLKEWLETDEGAARARYGTAGPMMIKNGSAQLKDVISANSGGCACGG